MPPFWWIFLPYTAYLLMDGVPRVLNPSWYFGFAVRSVIAVIAYLACALADIEEIDFVLLGVLMIRYGLRSLSTCHWRYGRYLQLDEPALCTVTLDGSCLLLPCGPRA